MHIIPSHIQNRNGISRNSPKLDSELGLYMTGAIALVLSTLLMVYSSYNGAMSIFWLNFGAFLWLLGNFVWMMGEFILENPYSFYSEVNNNPLELAALKYDELSYVAQCILITGSIWLFLYYFVRMFTCIPKFDRLDRFTMRQNENCPPPRIPCFFQDYSEYAAMHIMLWCIKDTVWIEYSAVGYICIFVPTFLIFCDLLYLTSTYRGQFIEFFHNMITLIWLIANLLWAMGELILQDDSAEEVIRLSYSWPLNPTSDGSLCLRYAVGYLFMVALILVVCFHVTWIVLTFSGRLTQREGSHHYPPQRDNYSNDSKVTMVSASYSSNGAVVSKGSSKGPSPAGFGEFDSGNV